MRIRVKNFIILFISIFVLASTGSLHAQFEYLTRPSTSTSYRLPNVIAENTPTWPTSTFSFSQVNPVSSLNKTQSTTVSPWSAQSSNNLLLTTYTGSYFGTTTQSSSSALGGTTSTSSTLSLPWMNISSTTSSSQSTGMVGFLPAQTFSASTQTQVSSKPTPYDQLHPSLAAVLLLQDNAAAGLALDRTLADNAMVIDGERYYMTANYIPAGSSTSIFPAHTSSSGSQVTTVGNTVVGTSAYSSYNPTGYNPYAATGLPTYSYGFGYPGATASSTGYPTVIDDTIVEEIVEGELVEGELIEGEPAIVEDHSGDTLIRSRFLYIY